MTEFSWIKALGLLAKVPLRPIRRLVEERRILRHPDAASKDHADQILEEALKRLGHVEAHDAVWIKAKAKVTSSIITTEHVRKPHVQSWISGNKEDLKLLARVETLAPKSAPYQRLQVAYMQTSGESEPHAAASTIHVVFAFLRYGLLAEVKDRGLAAQLELGLTAVNLGIHEMHYPSLGSPHSHVPAMPPAFRHVDVDEVHRLFGTASRLLLGWPQETNGQWIERPELAALRRHTTEEGTAPTVLLGRPGSGKSAILARLGAALQEEHAVVLLAIKADELPRACQTLADIDAHVGCSLVDGVRELSKARRVVVLIDQLDALADLMDQHSSRLSALLELAQSTSHVPNVSVLMSCREFEYQSDLRLTALHAEEVRLDLPPWEMVGSLLRNAGVAVEQLTDEQREVLRTPQHLAVFVRYFAGQASPPVFATYQALLDRVTRDLRTRHGDHMIAAAEHIATTMAEDEELWIARVRFEAGYGDEVDQLLAAEVLVSSDDELSVSFRHQTVFDFLRARAFLRDNTGLADYIIHRKQESLFVRPVLWSALAYLRGSDTSVYRREFEALWSVKHLRLHLRLLLASHLAQLEDPDMVEAAWLLPTLEDPALRPRVLTAMAGSTGWFERIMPQLGAYMIASPKQAKEVSFLLERALTFARTHVLRLLEENWLGKDDFCSVAMNVLTSLETWDQDSGDLAARFAAQAGRIGLDPFFTCQIVSKAVEKAPASAAQVLFEYVAALSGRMVRPEELAALVRHGHHWSQLAEPFAAAPSDFVNTGWRWLKDSLAPLAAPNDQVRHTYRSCPGFFVRVSDQNTLMSAFDLAITGFAQSDPIGFLAFLEQEEQSDLMVLHSLLARGLKHVAAAYPAEVVDYLLADPRRFAIGDFEGQRRETVALLAAVMPSINDVDLTRLESAVLKCSLYRDFGGTVQERFDRRQYDRSHRLRLLRAFPPEQLSTEARRLAQEEERALPSAKAPDGFTYRGGFVGSPMSAEEMAHATVEEIVRLFEGLPDQTGRNHPTRGPGSQVGGSVQASRAFAEFAKAQPGRALAVMSRFEPSRQERPAGVTLAALGDSGVPPETLLTCIRGLHDRGFSSDEFRAGAASCLKLVAERSAGLDDATCELLEGWISDASAALNEEESVPSTDLNNDEQTEDATSHSLLWSPGAMLAVPAGNFPILEALALGHLCRSPVDADGFLHIVERHLDRCESTDVWVAMTTYLTHLDRADRKRAERFLSSLLDLHPDVILHPWAVRFVVSSLSWIPAKTLNRIFDGWTSGGWTSGPQAAGEVAAVALCRSEGDDRQALNRVERYLADKDQPPQLRRSLAIGLTHTFVEAAGELDVRPFAVPYLVRLIATADDGIAPALGRLFWGDSIMRPDEHSENMLEAFLERPQMLDIERDDGFVGRLQSLLAAGWNPALVHKAAMVYLDARSLASHDAALRYSYTDDQLVDLALTLHHMPQTRVEGLDLFERLMALSTYGMPKQLATLDRHAP